MRIYKREKPDFFIVIEYILCAIIILSTLLARPEITSTGFTVSFLVLLVQFFIILLFPQYKRRYLLPASAILIVSFLCVMISTLLLDGEISFEASKEYFIFAATVILTFVLMCIPVKKATVSFILKFNVWIACLYPIAYLFFPLEGTADGLLYLNFTNPNLTGMWILQSILYLSLAFLLLNSVFYKILSGVFFLFDCFLLYLTGARNTWISFVLFLVLILFSVRKGHKKFGKALIVFINLVPILFVPLYLKLIAPVMESGWFSFLAWEGKGLDSRVGIWMEKLGLLHGYWLTGAYPIASGNMHNAYLVVLCSYGIVTLVMLICYFTAISLNLNQRIHNRKGLYCLSAFFASLFMGFGEGALFSGGQGIYILCCGFILLARYFLGKKDDTSRL